MEIKIRVGAVAMALIVWFSWNTATSLANSFKIWQLEKKYEILNEAVVGEIKMLVFIDTLTEIFQKFMKLALKLVDNLWGTNDRLDSVWESMLNAEVYYEDIIKVGNGMIEFRNTIFNNEYKNNEE